MPRRICTVKTLVDMLCVWVVFGLFLSCAGSNLPSRRTIQESDPGTPAPAQDEDAGVSTLILPKLKEAIVANGALKYLANGSLINLEVDPDGRTKTLGYIVSQRSDHAWGPGVISLFRYDLASKKWNASPQVLFDGTNTKFSAEYGPLSGKPRYSMSAYGDIVTVENGKRQLWFVNELMHNNIMGYMALFRCDVDKIVQNESDACVEASNFKRQVMGRFDGFGPIISGSKPGTFVIPLFGHCQQKYVDTCHSSEPWRVEVARTEDFGVTWTFVTIVESAKAFAEPNLIQLGDGRLLAQIRYAGSLTNGDERKIYQSTSLDDGKSWSPVVKSNLSGINSVTKIDPCRKELISIVTERDNGVMAINMTSANKVFSDPLGYADSLRYHQLSGPLKFGYGSIAGLGRYEDPLGTYQLYYVTHAEDVGERWDLAKEARIFGGEVKVYCR